MTPAQAAPVDDDVMTEALALMAHMRVEEGRLQAAAARRLTDPRRDALQVTVELAQGLQALRAETVRQVVALARAGDDRRRALTEERRLTDELAEQAHGDAARQQVPPPGGEQLPPPPFLAPQHEPPARPELRCVTCQFAPDPEEVVRRHYQPGTPCPSCRGGELQVVVEPGGPDDERADA